MDALSRRELQKLCVKHRDAKILPKETKCNGTTRELRELLIKREPPVEPYKNSLRGIATYLSYDKLLLLVAYYPEHPLLEELRDPNGKIWSDRLWVEIGGPGLVIKGFGRRYYHLWLTQRFLPWGHIYVGGYLSRFIARHIATYHDREFYYYESDDEERNAPYDLSVWAILPEGLCYFHGRIDDPSKASSFAILDDPQRWRVLSPRNYIYVGSFNKERAFALDSEGNLHQIAYNPTSHLYQEKVLKTRVRYLRPVYRFSGERIIYWYGIDDFQKTFLLDTAGNIIEAQEDTLDREDYYTIYYEDPERDFERFYYKSRDPKAYGVIDSTYKVRALPNIHPEKLYYIPQSATVGALLRLTGSLPREDSYGYILGLDGRVYEFKQRQVVRLTFGTSRRFQYYEEKDFITAGILW